MTMRKYRAVIFYSVLELGGRTGKGQETNRFITEWLFFIPAIIFIDCYSLRSQQSIKIPPLKK